jgi:hypothetical protein
MATTRERLHEILDVLLEDRLEDAEAVLTPLLDPVGLALINAPEDDEPFTDEDLAAIAETRDELARGLTIPHEVVRRELGR